MDGGVCVKDRDELSALLARPRACATSEQCPGGSFCDTTAGRCDWDCFSDSDCGSGFTCSCEGQCFVEGTQPDAGAGDVTCERNLGVLTDVTTRECLRDESCAVGSRCDEVTRHCTYDCMETSDCAAGEVCNCRGECTTGPTEAAPPALSRPTTEVEPAFLPVPSGGTWGVQTFSVNVKGRALAAGTELQARIEVLDPDPMGAIGVVASPQAGESVEVIGGVFFAQHEHAAALTWLGDTAGTNAALLQTRLGIPASEAEAIIAMRPITNLRDVVAAYLLDRHSLQRLKTSLESQGSGTCSATAPPTVKVLRGTDWVATSDGWRASFSIRRCGTTYVDATRQRIAVSTYVARTPAPGTPSETPPEVVDPLDYIVAELGVDGINADAATTLTGVFEGNLTIVGRAAGDRMTVPVTAWATHGDALVIFDQLSLMANGPIVLRASESFVDVLKPGDGSRGALTARVFGWSDAGGRNGVRSGQFSLAYGNSARKHRVMYALRRVGSSDALGGTDSPLSRAPTCTSTSPCATGQMCVTALAPAPTSGAGIGRCVAGTTAPTSVQNTIQHPTEGAWRQAGSFLDYLSQNYRLYNDSFDCNGAESACTTVDGTDYDHLHPSHPTLSGERLMCYSHSEEQVWAAIPADDAHPLGKSKLFRHYNDWHLFGFADEFVFDPGRGGLSCRFYRASADGLGESGSRGTFAQSAVPLAASTRANITRWHPGTHDQHLTSHPGTTADSSGPERLATCLEDLERSIPELSSETRNIPAQWPVASARVQAQRWFGAAAKCINLSQVFPALGSFAYGAVNGTTPRTDSHALSLLASVFMQWLDVHAFLATQGRQELEAQNTIDASSAPSEQGLATTGRLSTAGLLDRLELGWDLLLDQSFAGSLAALNRNVLFTDHRATRPSAYYAFDSVVSGRFVDLAGSSHLTASGAGSTVSNGRFRRTGTGSTSPSPITQAVVPLGDMTLSFWLDSNSPVAGSIYYPYWTNNGLKVAIGNVTGSAINIEIWHRDTGLLNIPVTKQGWIHVVVQRDERRYRVFTSASATLYTATVPGGAPSPTTEMYVGHGPTGLMMDEMGIWATTLSDAEVAAHRAWGHGALTVDRLGPLAPEWIPTTEPDHDPRVGFATKILDTATSHADLLSVFATESLAEIYGSCYLGRSSSAQRDVLARAGRSLRYLSLMEAFAADLYQRGGEVVCSQAVECTSAAAAALAAGRISTAPTLSCGSENVCVTTDGQVWLDEPTWSDEYRESLGRFAAARGTAIAAVERLTRCENPLGVPEDDLPLYFGDVTGDNARFFASSDYVLDRWANPSVDEAAAALNEARAAWQSMRQSNVQQAMNEYESERRLEGLLTTYVNPVIEACGLTEYDPMDVIPAFTSGELTPLDCFRIGSCADDEGRCLRGQLGSAALDMKAAATALYLASRQQDRREQEWEVQEDICERVSRSIMGDFEQIVAYKEKAKAARRKSKGFFGKIGGWLDDKLHVDFFESAFDYLRGCYEGSESGAANAPPHPAAQAAAATKGCVLGLDKAFGAHGAADLELAKEDLGHALQISEGLRQQAACWDEVGRRARDVEFGIEFAQEQIVALEQAQFRVDELSRAVSRNVHQARAILDREAGRVLPSVAHHYWTDEKVTRFRREMERARRMTFLAMRAVEFELQQSLGFRSPILMATHPDQLEEIVDALDSERAARTLNGRRPATGTEVVSLRTDLLGLLDLAQAPPGERKDTAVARLQAILVSEAYAVYDEDGSYIGQGIPFSLNPAGALEHRCAERLWRASATIQGDLTDVEEPGVHVFLRKNNVFQSQWCEGQGDGSDYQQASTSHTANLFRSDLPDLEATRSEYTTAVMFPWFNVRRSDFYRASYTEGASEELAGRGLYGEYVLLFPLKGMLEKDPDCNEAVDEECGDPFRDLKKIEDVLIRFDYYSVDNLSL